MKLTDVVFKPSPLKKFTNYRDLGYKYKVVRVPALKDQVQSKKVKDANAPCVNELSRMMDCWKRHDFNQSLCHNEIQVFTDCIAASKAESKNRRSRLRPSKEVNDMLARFPQPASNLK